jgi:hypothetical protein
MLRPRAPRRVYNGADQDGQKWKSVFTGDGLGKAIEINQIIGSGTIVSVRGPGTLAPPTTLDAWKHFNDQLSVAAGRIRAVRMTLGFHNHDVEFIHRSI